MSNKNRKRVKKFLYSIVHNILLILYKMVIHLLIPKTLISHLKRKNLILRLCHLEAVADILSPPIKHVFLNKS